MGKTFYFISATLMISSYCQPTSSGNSNDHENQEKSVTDYFANTKVGNDNKTAGLNLLFTLSDAEKIMGEPAHLTDSSTHRKRYFKLPMCLQSKC